MTEFAGKTAIISGGAEGIGLSIAKALADEKMNIVIADIDTENLQNASAELEAAGAPVLAVALNVADKAQWQLVADKATVRFGKVHMVVNNAGITGDSGTIEQQNTKGWQWALDVNLMGVVYGAKVMVPLIKAAGWSMSRQWQALAVFPTPELTPRPNPLWLPFRKVGPASFRMTKFMYRYCVRALSEPVSMNLIEIGRLNTNPRMPVLREAALWNATPKNW